MNKPRTFKTIETLFIGSLFIALLFMGCTSSPFPLALDTEAFKPQNLSVFEQENLKSFTTFTLSNGIPVIIKQSNASQVFTLNLVLRGGSLLASPETAGFEQVALQTMARGSKNYSYEKIQSLLDATSSSLGAFSNFEYATFSVTGLQKYLDILIPIWADCLVHPSFLEKDFAQVLSDTQLALQSKEQDPWTKTTEVMNREFFGKHPYGNVPEGTIASLNSMQLQDATQWYARQFSANRIFIVAVGAVDPDKLYKQLEASIGTIPDKKIPLPPHTPTFSNTTKLVRHEYPASRGLAYLRGDFPAPAPTDPDYMALNVGLKIVSDLLFNVVRDKYGATYSPAAYIRAFPANYGSIVMYKTKVPNTIKAYIDEALADFGRGYCIAIDEDIAEDPSARVPIAEALPTYKALFINEYYQNQQTNAQQAVTIISSVINTGDYRSYLKDMRNIESLKADQVQAAVNKYLLKGTITWVVTGSKDMIDLVPEADFTAPSRN
ncbi:M16 family metallopeptidase [Gracilinema caldarium]|uniref:Peptidase M16 domain protein n=1 Tax=Gracilinema caldarium (strain ATCC 51460 / DSM 7334 / H1) TaxID=744872 RepID=F8EWS6_GRAC1|nr:pitrilysin family protein [Gracilinema caldarium]AEJ18312.1 peptidase M16 domain protein [Gracilinema caldarium DSM 7334]